MKKVIYIAAAAVLLFSCTTREDYFYNLNETPEVSLEVKGEKIESDFTDSIKLGLKYRIDYTTSDEIKSNLEILSSMSDIIKVYDNYVEVTPVGEGTSQITIKASDPFEKANEIKISLVKFTNLPPVAALTAKKVSGGLSPYEVNIDASASYDLDHEFGGEVVSYNYKINNNYDIETPLSQIRYIFEEPGQKKIMVRVKDNNGTWSSFKEVYVSF